MLEGFLANRLRTKMSDETKRPPWPSEAIHLALEMLLPLGPENSKSYGLNLLYLSLGTEFPED